MQVAPSALPAFALTSQERRPHLNQWSASGRLRHVVPKMCWKQQSTSSEQTVCLQLVKLAEVQHEISDFILL